MCKNTTVWQSFDWTQTNEKISYGQGTQYPHGPKSPVDVIAAAKMHLVECMTDIIWMLYFAYGWHVVKNIQWPQCRKGPVDVITAVKRYRIEIGIYDVITEKSCEQTSNDTTEVGLY